MGYIDRTIFSRILVVTFLTWPPHLKCKKWEKSQDLDQRNKFSNYWKEITAICVCACVMFLFDVIERGLQISDPFHSIWSTVAGESTAVSFTAFRGVLNSHFTTFRVSETYQTHRLANFLKFTLWLVFQTHTLIIYLS